jgi:outer membrane protein OmpA-like peptidoglycan-associated protein
MLICLLALTLFAGARVAAQENLRTELFGEVERTLDRVKERNADLYAPASFKKGMEYYQEGDDLYKRGRSLEDIRDKLKNASAYFAKALDECKAAEVLFSAVAAARNDAKSTGAPKSFPELWNKGESQFNKAAHSLEDGNSESARREADDAQTFYRSAELEAVKSNYLSPARELLARADAEGVRDVAPKTLEKARGLAVRVEELLKQNRHDADEARTLAQEARYEAAHALYLARTIRQIKKEDRTLEDVMLASESQFGRIETVLGLQSHFEKGLDSAVTEAIAGLKQRDATALKDAEQVRQTGESNREKEAEIENLKQQVSSMEGRVGSLTQSEKGLQRTLNQKHQEEETIRSISTMFTLEEGNVLRDGDDIVIRLYGLSFPVGKNTIEADYYGLLTKVQDVIKRYPKCSVTIEGHTDSQGSDELNQTLSESRAKSVAEYLMANMGVEIPINHHGYGESRPVASNDTPEGRAKNRRIDVVITPARTPEKQR